MMTDTNRATKRVVSVVVAVATLMWAVGLATLIAPLSASAATIPSGSLVKGSLPAVYYVGANGKRYVFVNQKTYNTWYSDFSAVQTISDADLASLMIGGNVTYKPGAKMLKIMSDPKTYAVSKGGVLRWVKTEAAAVGLYGSAWNQQIDDVSDSFFINYTVDGDINSASDYNKAQELANATSINADKGLDSSSGTTGGVMVSVASSSPSSMSIPSGAFYAPLLTLAVKNTTGAVVHLNGLTVRRSGIIGDSNVSGLLVTDGMGILHGTLVTFGQSVAQPGFASEPIKIAAGATENVTLSVNVGSAVSSGTIGASVLAATDLLVSDAAGAAVSVGGAFPLSGSMMNVVSGTGALGSLAIQTQSIIGGTSGTPIDIDQGAMNLDVAQFRLSENSGNEGVELMNLEVQNNGSASAGDFSNIRLIDQDNQVISTVANVVNNVAKFSILSMTGANAGPHGGYKLTSGQQRVFTVRIDTAANTNSATRTINFTVQNNFRVRAVGLSTGVGVTPVAGGTDTFPIGDTEGGANWVKFRAGTLTVSRSTESLSGKLAKGATNVPLASFDIRAFGEPIEIQEVAFVVLNGAGTGQTVGAKSLVGTIKINNAAGASVFSRTATDVANYGTGGCTSISNNAFVGGTCTGSPALTSLNSFTTIQSNSVGKLVFVGDIAQDAASTDGYTVKILGIKFRKVSSNTNDTNTSAISGNGLTIEASTLTVNKSSAYNPINLVKGGSLQKLGSFDLQAGAAEAQRVNALKVQVCSHVGPITSLVTHCDGADTTATGMQAVTNITLMQGATQLAPAQSITTTAGGTFSSQLTVPANQTVSVDVYGVVSSAYALANLGVSLNATSFTGLSSQTTNSGSAVLGQNLAISSGGVVSFTDLGNDGVVNVAKLLHASESDVPLFKFKIRETSNAEAMSVGKVYLSVKNALNTFSSYKLFNEATGQQIGSSNTAIIANGTHGEVRFGGLSIALAKGGEMNLVVKGSTVDAATVASGATLMDVLMGVTFVEYTGSVSGLTTRVGGGMAIGQSTLGTNGVVNTFTAGGDFMVVNEAANFSVCDAVQVDADNSGAFSGTTAGSIVETTVYYVNAVGSNTVSIGAVGTCVSALPAVGVPGAVLDITGTVTNGARITKYNFTSQNQEVQEIEPVITGLNVGSGNMVSENEVGTFVIRNDGNRSLIVEKLRFEVSGSYLTTAAAQTYGPTAFKLDRADPTTGARIANTLNAGAALATYTYVDVAGMAFECVPTVTAWAHTAFGSCTSAMIPLSGAVLEFSLVGIPLNEEVGAGSSKGYVLLANTTSVKSLSGSNSASTQVRMLGSKANPAVGTTDGLVWSYVRTSNGASSGSLTISDSYIVSGKSLTY